MSLFQSSVFRFVSGISALAVFVGAACGNNIVVNSGFEDPLFTIPGNNFPPTVPGWTLHSDVPTCENGHNVVFPNGAYAGGPDQAVDGRQYYEICGAAGWIEQPFTLTKESAVGFGAWFSRRDNSGGGGSVSILESVPPRLRPIKSSPYIFVAPEVYQENWIKSNESISSLPPGNYVVRVSLDDAANVDSVFVNLAPPDGVIGNGTPGSVTEVDLDCALTVAGLPITFNGGSAPIMISMGSTKTIDHNVTINGGNKVTLNGQGTGSMFVVKPGITLTLEDIVLDRKFAGNLVDNGGAIFNMGTLVLNHVRISNSSALGGGAISNTGNLTASNSIFEYNKAVRGGAIYNGGDAVLTNCVVAGNHAEQRGGAVFNAGSLETNGCAIKWNSAGDRGGGIASESSTSSGAPEASVQSTNDQIRGNTSGSSGGGLDNSADALIQNTEFSLNTATGRGGGVSANQGTITLDGVRLYNNTSSDGGGLAALGGTITVTRALIQFNRSILPNPNRNHGGGVLVTGGDFATTLCTITGSRISNNVAGFSGGGVAVTRPGHQAVFRNCIIAGNAGPRAQVYSSYGAPEFEDCTIGPSDSPGIVCEAGSLKLSRSTVRGNHSGDMSMGGGVSVFYGASALIENSTLSGNFTVSSGGGLFLHEGDGGASATVTNVTFAGNSAASGGNLFLGPGADVSLDMKNTILAYPASGGNCAGKAITSSSSSISSDNSCALTGTGDHTGTDPLLGPLQDNGGPTFTHLLLPGSPAINGVQGTQAPALDQRGRNRPAGGGSDIGAVEVNAGGGLSPDPPPASTFDGNDVADDDGDGMSDVNELLLHTDPWSPASVFRLSQSPSNPLQFTFPTRIGLFYRVYAGSTSPPNLLTQWSETGLGTIFGNGSVKSFTISPGRGIASRFYVVRVMATIGPWPP